MTHDMITHHTISLNSKEWTSSLQVPDTRGKQKQNKLSLLINGFQTLSMVKTTTFHNPLPGATSFTSEWIHSSSLSAAHAFFTPPARPSSPNHSAKPACVRADLDITQRGNTDMITANTNPHFREPRVLFGETVPVQGLWRFGSSSRCHKLQQQWVNQQWITLYHLICLKVLPVKGFAG